MEEGVKIDIILGTISKMRLKSSDVKKSLVGGGLRFGVILVVSGKAKKEVFRRINKR